MATVEQLTIQFSGKGAGTLTTQLNTLSKAMNRLARRQIEQTKIVDENNKKLDSYNQRLTKTGRNVDGITGIFGKFGKKMSQMRSQLLIVAFAVGLVSKAITSLTNAFAEYAKLNAKINAILKSTGSVAGFTAAQLDNMANVLERTMGVTSTQVKEMKARLLTFTNITTSAFKQAQVAAIDMAAVFGQDLSQATIQLGKALNDPAKGYTALRRIGVSFTAQQVESIKKFQEQGDVLSAQLVILDELSREFGGAAKAQTEVAFGTERVRKAMNELSEGMRTLGEVLQPVVFVFGSLLEKLVDMATTIPDALVNIGTLIAEFSALATKGKQLKDSLDFQEGFIKQHTSMVASLQALGSGFRDAAESATNFTKPEEFGEISNEIDALVQSQSAWGLMTGENEEIQKEIDILLEKYAKKMAINNSIISSQTVLQDLLNKKIDISEKSLKSQLDVLERRMTLDKDLSDGLAKLNEEEKVRLKFGDKVTDAQIEYAQAIDAINQKIQEGIDLKNADLEAEKALIESKELFFERMGELTDYAMERSREAADSEIANIDRREQRELEALRSTFKYRKSSDEQKKKLEKEITDREEKARKKARKKANKEMLIAFRVQQGLSIAETIMNTQKAAMLAMGQTGIFGFPMAAIIKAMGAVSVGLIAAQKPPTMQYGGLVGGNRHSQGGTMIEAERGEYVISRPGVEAAGIEALNRINAGGGDIGGTSIIINNPIIGKDTIEDEIVPQIKEALRRGGDIGI